MSTSGNPSQLEAIEAEVERALVRYLGLGTALADIKAGKLYLKTHSTWDAYVKERFGLERSHSYRLIEAAGAVRNLQERGLERPLPLNERQARPLVPLSPEQQVQVWSEAITMSPNGRPTSILVTRLAGKFRPDMNLDRLKDNLMGCSSFPDRSPDEQRHEASSTAKKAYEVKVVMSPIGQHQQADEDGLEQGAGPIPAIRWRVQALEATARCRRLDAEVALLKSQIAELQLELDRLKAKLISVRP